MEPVPAATEGPGVIRFRATIVEELEWVSELEGSSEVSPFVTPWTLEEHREALASSDWAHWVMVPEAGSGPLGYVLLAGLTGREIELRRMVVAEPGRGIGRAALRLVKSLAFESWGASRLWLDVFDFNERARALYYSEGFQQVEVVPGEAVGGPPGSKLLVLELRAEDLRCS